MVQDASEAYHRDMKSVPSGRYVWTIERAQEMICHPLSEGDAICEWKHLLSCALARVHWNLDEQKVTRTARPIGTLNNHEDHLRQVVNEPQHSESDLNNPDAVK